MARYDVVVIGAGLGGLTTGAILARAGRKVLVIERSNSVGGAASSYKSGDLFIEGSLQETSDPHDVRDPKHRALTRAGVIDAVKWIPAGALYEARGGPLDRPFVMPDNFEAARRALSDRFPDARDGIHQLLGEMERIASAMGTLAQGRDAFKNPGQALGALFKLLPAIRDWPLSLSQKLDRIFGQRSGQIRAGRQSVLFPRRPGDAVVGLFRDGAGQLPVEWRTLHPRRIATAVERARPRRQGCRRRRAAAPRRQRRGAGCARPRQHRHPYRQGRQRSANGGNVADRQQRRAGDAG